MATAQEIQAKIDDARNKEEAARQVWENFEVGSPPTQAEITRKNALFAEYEKATSQRQKIEKPLLDARNNLDTVRSSIEQAQNVARNPQARASAEKEIARLRTEETKLVSFLEGGSDISVVSKRTRGGVRVEPQGPVLAGTPGRPSPALTPEQQAGLRRRGEVTGGMGATRPRPGEPAPTGPAQPTTQGGGVTTGRGGAGAGGGTGGRRRVVNWEPKFREMFPAQAWLLDLDRTKYGDVFKLFQKAISDRMYETPEGQARFAAQLDGTSFFKELATTGKARDIKALVGDLGFDTVPFNKFLTTAMNMGWDGDTLKQEAYKEAFRKDDAGTYVNPTAVKRVQASNDYVRVKNIGRAFFSDVNDATVEQALTGGVTQDDIMRQQRELAKGKYAHLAPLLDQGLTLDDITSSYKERAARLLEKDVNDIDMGSADFSQAFNFGEEGKKRMMGDGEWEILLRSDQRFGWRKTQNAKQEATQLASSIGQAFGRVL